MVILRTYHPCIPEFQVCSNEGLCPFSNGDSIAKLEKYIDKNLQNREWPRTFPRGDNRGNTVTTFKTFLFQNKWTYFIQTQHKALGEGGSNLSNEWPCPFLMEINMTFNKSTCIFITLIEIDYHRKHEMFLRPIGLLFVCMIYF